MQEERIMQSLERLEKLHGSLERQDSMTSFMLDAIDVLTLSVSAEASEHDDLPQCTCGIILSGCSIGCIMDGSPAMECGAVSVGDVIVKVDGQEVSSQNIEEAMKGCDLPGSLVWLTVRKRDGLTNDALMHRVRVGDMFQRTVMVQALARLQKAAEEGDMKAVSATAAEVHRCWQKNSQESLRSQGELLENLRKVGHGLKNWLIDWKKELETMRLQWRDAFYENGVMANDLVRFGNKALEKSKHESAEKAETTERVLSNTKVPDVGFFNESPTNQSPSISVENPKLFNELPTNQSPSISVENPKLFNELPTNQSPSISVENPKHVQKTTPSERNNDSLHSNESSRKIFNDDKKIGARAREKREKRQISDPLTQFEEANANLMESVLENEILGVILAADIDIFTERAKVVDIMPGSLISNQRQLCVGDLIVSIDGEKIISVDHAEYCLKQVLGSRKKAILDIDRKGVFHQVDIDARGHNSKHAILLPDKEDEQWEADAGSYDHSPSEKSSEFMSKKQLLEVFKSKEYLLEG
ncbi:hypothetical protein GUITHDRAFT_162252 [Guillardia theta CCMP2712]|uniref:PDZ domain-containing protein n=1 Tax=Guillardia theta (strain CCMP2712) TaxID=905079 RepID=L1JLR1_GUITC|nr:hypothetical protein GUITHDRAFT_162252 [Guillardia theta CCMP2712]EKX49129.1 hypothetical protein GUITHDRAFT_162252 [Guillardia theta CCMP2712]|eukprot:XP_005836109.1 hypothetical protein GUITHDRAFT_162252 [Guillardia theta CCMP2712]